MKFENSLSDSISKCLKTQGLGRKIHTGGVSLMRKTVTENTQLEKPKERKDLRGIKKGEEGRVRKDL